MKRTYRNGEKRCGNCEEYKPVSQFYRRTVSVDGLSYNCKKCALKIGAEWVKNKPKHERQAIYHERDLRRKFGIDGATYQAMLVAQNGVCGICGKPRPVGNRLAVDHDHEKGNVRGLLCSLCNLLLHKVEVDPVWMDKAISYLSKHTVEGLLTKE